MCSGICTWMTSAPQSASCRAAVGPARTWVRSRTRKRARACEAGMCGMARVLVKDIEFYVTVPRKTRDTQHATSRVPLGRNCVKIATFNVNSIRGRLSCLLEWLHDAQPDVACLQELRIFHEE